MNIETKPSAHMPAGMARQPARALVVSTVITSIPDQYRLRIPLEHWRASGYRYQGNYGKFIERLVSAARTD